MAIQSGDRWIYSAGFNVSSQLNDTTRIELTDMRHLSDQGARVAVLSHQGSWKNQDALHLDFVAHYLALKLNRRVSYFPSIYNNQAIAHSHSMQNGDITIYGNTRFHAEEELENLSFAKHLSQFGDFVALGGFSKAHRRHASNTGLMKHLPAYLTEGFVDELTQLDSLWSPGSLTPLVAIVGGMKDEKIMLGFPAFCRAAAAVVPTGVVLNVVLRSLGIDVGQSYLGTDPQRSVEVVSESLRIAKAKVILPSTLIVASLLNNCVGEVKTIRMGAVVPRGFSVVDFYANDGLQGICNSASLANASVLVAGTPCMVNYGFNRAKADLVNFCRRSPSRVVLMGGDTVSDLALDCKCSTGGGASLFYISNGTLPVLEELFRNQLV